MSRSGSEEEGSPPPCKKLRVDGGEELESAGPPEHVATEGEVGIKEFGSEHEGFFAILKRRYCDFMVHELAEDGSVVKFTSRSLPFEAEVQGEGDEASLVQLLGSETALSIKELSESPSDKQVEVTVPLDKAKRTLLHKTVRALYPLLESETVEPSTGKPEHKNIMIRRAIKSGKNNSNSRGAWPRERGSHCQFVLYKENKDTMEAVSVISRLLKIKTACFQYAGVKDRRAITCQLLTAFKVSAEKLQSLNPKLRNMQLGNFKYVSNSMKLGSLSGNKFTVVLRNVSCEDHVILKAVKSLGEAGFVNYYGMQRFGTSVIPTHHIGRCLIHSDWKGAIDLVLKPRSGELGEVEHARKYYHNTGDVAGTLFRMPKARYVERQLLLGLQKHAVVHNYLGAFNFIPRNTRLMYVHSWQSFCWNHLASWRLRELGRGPVIGDLVQKDRFTRNSSEPKAVEYVTAENKDEYDIHDVVLPLPGYDILLPDNAAKDEYERVLNKEGVTMENLKNRVKDMSLVGSYRHVVVKPRDIDWKIILYDDLSIPLVLTDLDLFTGKRQPQSLPEGSLKAVKVEFSLPSSCYATMAIRELLKMDTSPAFQTSLNETACDSIVTEGDM